MSIELDVINKKLNKLNLENGGFLGFTSIDSMTRGSNIALLKQLVIDIEATYADKIANETMKAQAEACFNNSLKAIEAMKHLKLPEAPSIPNLLLNLHEDSIRLKGYGREMQRYEQHVKAYAEYVEVRARDQLEAARKRANEMNIAVEMRAQYVKDKVKEHQEESMIARLKVMSSMYNLKRPSLYNPFMGVSTIRN